MTTDRKTGSRPFSPIYENFQNLLDNNQGIFRLFRKTKNPGMYQAVWQARQGEVDTLKERLNQMELRVTEKMQGTLELDSEWRERECTWFEEHQHLLERIRDLKHMIESKNHQINSLQGEVKRTHEETVAGLESEISTWKEKYFHIREDLEKYKTLSRSLNRVVEMKKGEDLKTTKDVRNLENHLRLSQQALIKLDDEYEKVCSENDQLKSRIEELEEELQKSNSYAKEFRRINHRMENELYRVTSELERTQSMLN